MAVNQAPDRTKSEIQQTRDAIRRLWSREEREKRRSIAEACQQSLLSYCSHSLQPLRPTLPNNVLKTACSGPIQRVSPGKSRLIRLLRALR
jgi:hypothetical protein